MATLVPKTSVALKTLLQADFTTQWRNRRAVVLTLIVPVIILMTWKVYVKDAGGPFVLSNSITIGLFALGLMGYSNSIARDRDKGVFQRLRVAPLPSWTIMASRLLVQLGMILLITTAVFIIGMEYDGITLAPCAYIITYFTAIVGGAVSLSLGQAIVGLIKSPETINATSRLVYLAFVLLGIFGQVPSKDAYMLTLGKFVQWSPYGTIKTLLAVGMEPAKWNTNTTLALLITLGYVVIFSVLGIKWFKWDTKS